METQQVLSIILTLLILALSWLMKILWSSITSLSKRLRTLEVLVAGDYVKQEDFHRTADKIFVKLDSLTERCLLHKKGV